MKSAVSLNDKVSAGLRTQITTAGLGVAVEVCRECQS